MSAPVRALLGAALAIAAGAAIAGGFVLVGSPQDARLARLDDRRVADLQFIQRAVNLHWTRTKRLPDTVDAATADTYPVEPVRDPVSKSAYGYRALDGSSYELCATFDRAAGERGYSVGDPFWSHGAGRQCFTLTVPDPNRHGPR
jgi:hypothetical protein